MATVHEMAVLARCTRDGRILWGHVAKQLGKSEHDTRSQLDPHYMREPQSLPSNDPPLQGWARFPDITARDLVVMAVATLESPTSFRPVAQRTGLLNEMCTVAIKGAKTRGWIVGNEAVRSTTFKLTPKGQAYAARLLAIYGEPVQ